MSNNCIGIERLWSDIHCIELKMNNNFQFNTIESHFFIKSEIGSINELGRKMANLLGEDGTVIEGIYPYFE